MREQPTVPNRAHPTRPEPPTVRRPVPPSRPRPVAPPPARPGLPPTLQAPLPEPPRAQRPPRPVRPMPLPLLLPAIGGAWWAVGASALDTGAGTLVLALGLSLAVALGIALHRRLGTGAPLPPGGRLRVLRIALVAVAGIVLGGWGLRLLGLGEVTVPLACGITGLALFAFVRLVDERIIVALAGALLVLAAVGASLAFGTPGALYPQGLVGMGAGALCCAAAAVRGGLVAELLARRRG
ncbi:hypothetical protein ACQEVB_19520 [Pseudonocardia sp. CA-107938]|uniref:hypothetical protein n=1 Tax=Pseudonocardia sp. CA-107938 TaxID=3240021 RepID=UPI003D8B586D